MSAAQTKAARRKSVLRYRKAKPTSVSKLIERNRAIAAKMAKIRK